MLIAASFMTSPNRKQCKRHQLQSGWNGPPGEDYAARKKNNLLLHTPQMNLNNIVFTAAGKKQYTK